MENGTLRKINFCLALFSILNVLDFSHAACYRKPQGASGDRSPADENYQIQIDGNPSSYIPGQQYNISLSSGNGLKFISFTLLVEAESSSPTSSAGIQALGSFKIVDKVETKSSALCENMIENSNTNAKHRIDVAWVAPSDSQGGCVLFKAAVLQHRDVWFIDDGFLTKRLCPEEIDEMNGQTPLVNPCCACDEAKYEIILERKWRRNTHAKDFPSEPWRTKLGEVVGASHSLDYYFWKYGGRANQGLQELAEHGATKTLENEIKKHIKTGSIRTIIKAPGIKYHPNIIGKTLANARVGPKHHVISLVLKIDPSPDWILGVSGLELCLANCTWIKKKVLNLYPWDIGTDLGPSYMSPDQAQHPPDVIRRISSTFPSDYRSPFFDQSGAPMKPLATLHVIRKRTYEGNCNLENTGALECSTHPWSSWSECSVKCGEGEQYRRRYYKDIELANSFNCSVVLEQKKTCIGHQCGAQQAEYPTAECQLTNWSPWSECSNNCGEGLQTRTRNFRNPYAREKCRAGVRLELQQSRQCSGKICSGNIPSSYNTNNNDMFDQNFHEQEAEENLFKRPDFYIKSFDKSQQRTNWSVPETENEQTNYDDINRNFNSNYDNDNDFRSQAPNSLDINKNEEEIYGNEKLVGGRYGQPYEHDQVGNTNTRIYGGFDPNLSDIRQTNNNKIFNTYKETDDINRRPGFNNSPNTIYNQRDPYGFKTIESEEADPQGNSFCFEKPIATAKRCNKKRTIVKNYWFYDADDGECKLFTADNCDENKNKFLSMEKCQETCSQTAMQGNQDTMAINRGRYNSRRFEVTQQPPFQVRWN